MWGRGRTVGGRCVEGRDVGGVKIIYEVRLSCVGEVEEEGLIPFSQTGG